MVCRVLVVEDDQDWQAYFLDILTKAPGFEATAIAGTLREAETALRRYRFDAALVDMGLPDGTGIDVLMQLARIQPQVEAAICTIFDDPAQVMAAIHHGAAGYILKESAATGLISMLTQMMAGGSPISPKVARHILNAVAAPLAGATPTVALTPRETEVLAKIATGQTLRQVGESLGIAESTVRTHVKRIYSKLDVTSRGAALLEASRRRIL